MPATLHHGDCLSVLRSMPDNSVDLVVSDPPYGLAEHSTATIVAALTAWVGGDREHIPDGHGFMSARWDRFVPPPAVFDELVRVLKPGGHAAIFSHARTQDLMGLSARLAGFELRDTFAWLNSQGMAKGTNLKRHADRLGEQYAGYASALKPGYEPILLLRAPLAGSVPSTIEKFGTGALNIEECRLGWANDADRASAEAKNAHARFGSAPTMNTILGDASMLERKDYDGGRGRWPANVILSEEDASALDEMSGISRSYRGKPRSGRRDDDDVYGSGRAGFAGSSGPEYDDIGGASRFFYCPKVKKSDRLILPDGTTHMTVKPRALMDWLVTLLSPPGDGVVVLDPFAGTSTTLAAAHAAGHVAIGIEDHGPHIELSRMRFDRDGAPLSVIEGLSSTG